MVSHPFVYQIVLFALIWLFIMLHLTRPTPGMRTPVTPAEPKLLKPKRHRSHEPKPFEGLTHKPPCALCARDTASPQSPPPVPPDRMPPTNRRPREVDTSRHFCPHAGCAYRGWLGFGNLRANGQPSGRPWRQFHCTSCNGYFLETHGTLFHGKQAAVDLIVRVVACLAEGLGIRATARVFEVDANTVLHWLAEAAEQLRAFSAYFLCKLHLEQLQLDELYAVLREVKDGDLSEDEAIRRLERSPYWVWTAMDPKNKLLVVVEVGSRTLAMAQRVVHQVTWVLAPGCMPLFLTDGLKDYGTAFSRILAPGCHPNDSRTKAQDRSHVGCRCPRCSMPRLSSRTGVGAWCASVTASSSGRLRRCSRCWQPAAGRSIRRLSRGSNLNIRQHVAAVGRRVSTLCKGEDGLGQQLSLYHCYLTGCEFC